jgi:hypothetical protein
MWAARQPTTARREWIANGLGDDDRREPVVLAAGLSPQVASDATAPAESVNLLLGALARAARSSSPETETPGDTPTRWTHSLRIATTPVPPSLRSTRNDLLAELLRSDYEQVLAAALAALADARTDSHDTLELEQVTAVAGCSLWTFPSSRGPQRRCPT